MLDWDKQREQMITEQIQARGITNKKLIDALHKTPRHPFIPEGLRDMSYEDHPVSLGHGQTISQPYIIALMIDRLELTGKEKVLEIGTGTGFQAALLSKLAKEVYSVEIVAPLIEKAKELLKELKRKNVKLLYRDGSNGYEAKAPYDRIIVSAASKEVPPAFLKQLKVGGILILPIGNRFHQDLKKIRKTKEGFQEQTLCGCVFVPLVTPTK
ncbi:MAG: protein-L-isoaspartate(D-aspartate) O-methyltransferase [Nanoarchaeota archaeon]